MICVGPGGVLVVHFQYGQTGRLGRHLLGLLQVHVGTRIGHELDLELLKRRAQPLAR